MEGIKRKHSPENKSTGNNTDSTPTKDKQRSDGHYSTPVKRRLEFNFWHKDTQSAEQKTSSIKISELKKGFNISNHLVFRVTLKSKLRETTKGKVFSFHGMDSSCEIAFTAFREDAEKWFESIEVNKIYNIQDFAVKEESEAYPSGTGNKLQIIVNTSSIIVKQETEDGIPNITFKFVEIPKIKDLVVKSKTDVCGIIVKDWMCETTSMGTSKRDLALTDKSKSMVNITLWGTAAETFSAENFVAIAIRNATVSEYLGNKSLNCNHDTLVLTDPNLKEAVELKTWFDEEVQTKEEIE